MAGWRLRQSQGGRGFTASMLRGVVPCSAACWLMLRLLRVRCVYMPGAAHLAGRNRSGCMCWTARATQVSLAATAGPFTLSCRYLQGLQRASTTHDMAPCIRAVSRMWRWWPFLNTRHVRMACAGIAVYLQIGVGGAILTLGQRLEGGAKRIHGAFTRVPALLALARKQTAGRAHASAGESYGTGCSVCQCR